ncbi:replication initiation factor domain-containing protein [Frateuria edaphi]|uniref:replication initiation factor domain-containing protein n=1 Tax=Frateuria edaphi TaxID=2898793 RepID=UPI001E5D8FB4|nr:replication initiation factor domain-containing protein [Frateuria edaphi]UGB47232.1 replication initiation factor domain-containing protein [Frateuria edaphi]
MTRREPKVPSANRGPTNLNEQLPCVADFLRFTTREAVVFEDAFDDAARVRKVLAFLDWFFPASGLVLEGEAKGGRRGYTHHFQLLTPDGVSCGDVAYGGDRQRGTVSVELTGAACALVARSRPFADAWGHVRDCLDTVGARITEYHAAHDDYSGMRNLDTAREMYEAGAFDGAFKRPAMQRVGWNDGSGQTLYIGKKTATRQMVVYEKGREQGLRDGDEGVDWVRWEARFYARNREIPTAVLVAPWEYVVGEFPCMDWMSAVMSLMRTAVETAKGNFASAVRHCKRQYGGLLHLVAKLSMDDYALGAFVRQRIARAVVPRWVQENPLSGESLGVAFATHQLAI